MSADQTAGHYTLVKIGSQPRWHTGRQTLVTGTHPASGKGDVAPALTLYPVCVYHYRRYSPGHKQGHAPRYTKFVKNSFLPPRHALLLLSVLLLLLTACLANERPVIVVTATPDSAPTRVAAALAAPAASAPALNPLTGLVLPDPAVLHRRPLAVKISNAPDSVRPQAGLALADLVFEHYVEGGLTRFTAIYWTHTPPRLGSIRSARLIDLELTAMYGAILVYSGANEPIRQRIAASTFAARAYEGVTVGEPLYFRDPAGEAPHNLFAVPAQVWARAAADGVNDAPNLRALAFSTTPSAGGQAAPAVTVDYGPDVVHWVYDAVNAVYVRSVDGVPHTDADTGAPITAANVVVLYVPHRDDETIPVGEWNGVPIYSTEIQLWESGPALIARDGVALTGTWMRWEQEVPLTLWADEEATQPLPLKPGITWFEIVPTEFTGVTLR